MPDAGLESGARLFDRSTPDIKLSTNVLLATGGSSQTQNLTFATPNGSSGAPTFRALVYADLPYTPVNKAGDTMTGLLILSADATSALGAATLQQVQAAQAGLGTKAPAKLATTGALSGTPTYNNGTAGVGATLAAAGNGTLTVDGVLTALNDRILVKDQVTQTQNGIYKVTTAGAAGAAYVLTRATDFDNTVVDSVSNFQYGAYVLVEQGTANQGVPYVFSGGVGTATPGTTAITFTVFSVPNSGVTSFTANTSGLQASSATGAVTLSFASQTQNTFLAAPNGSSGAPTFRAIAPTDLPVATGAAFGAVETGANITNTAGVISLTATNVQGALGYTVVDNEVPTGLNNNSNLTYTLAHSPIAASLKVRLNGRQLTPTTHYTLSTNTISIVSTFVLQSNESLVCDYHF